MPDITFHHTTSDRRHWLTSCIRYTITAVLLLTSGVLIRRRFRARCVNAQLACSQCTQHRHCGLPRAVDYRDPQRT